MFRKLIALAAVLPAAANIVQISNTRSGRCLQPNGETLEAAPCKDNDPQQQFFMETIVQGSQIWGFKTAHRLVFKDATSDVPALCLTLGGEDGPQLAECNEAADLELEEQSRGHFIKQARRCLQFFGTEDALEIRTGGCAVAKKPENTARFLVTLAPQVGYLSEEQSPYDCNKAMTTIQNDDFRCLTVKFKDRALAWQPCGKEGGKLRRYQTFIVEANQDEEQDGKSVHHIHWVGARNTFCLDRDGSLKEDGKCGFVPAFALLGSAEGELILRLNGPNNWVLGADCWSVAEPGNVAECSSAAAKGYRLESATEFSDNSCKARASADGSLVSLSSVAGAWHDENWPASQPHASFYEFDKEVDHVFGELYRAGDAANVREGSSWLYKTCLTDAATGKKYIKAVMMIIAVDGVSTYQPWAWNTGEMYVKVCVDRSCTNVHADNFVALEHPNGDPIGYSCAGSPCYIGFTTMFTIGEPEGRSCAYTMCLDLADWESVEINGHQQVDNGGAQTSAFVGRRQFWPLSCTWYCGDGNVNPGEECDDGNNVDTDSCTNGCQNAVCGDGVVQEGVEECDDSNTVDDDTCHNDCTLNQDYINDICGDGVATGDELCDDGNDSNLDECLNDCTPNTCGDGHVCTACGEDCDDGNTINTDSCLNTCVDAACGDGVHAPSLGEECDDGNQNDNDDCLNNCDIATCGDNVLGPGEQCDDGNGINTDSCTNGCTDPICGDEIVSSYVDPVTLLTVTEECDDGNFIESDACKNDCTLNVCGDGVQKSTELCDDGNEDQTDGCLNDCTLPSCGDGHIGTYPDPNNPTGPDIVEECDDQNTVNSDDCINCVSATCGDNIRRTSEPNPEECDDGNENDNDACKNDCTDNVCGDGVVRTGVEECDDGNESNNDSCLNTCVWNTCRDGHREIGVEECDDGNENNNDFCTNDCNTATCHDGILRTASPDPEECDDGNLFDDDFCVDECKDMECGDGHVGPGEECDDGNAVDTDDCKSDCTWNICGDSVTGPDEACDDGNQDNTDDCLNTCELASCRDGFVHAGVEECDDNNDDDLDHCTNGCKIATCRDGKVCAVCGEECDDDNDNNNHHHSSTGTSTSSSWIRAGA
jgi:cysteine-rich repeat protein